MLENALRSRPRAEDEEIKRLNQKVGEFVLAWTSSGRPSGPHNDPGGVMGEMPGGSERRACRVPSVPRSVIGVMNDPCRTPLVDRHLEGIDHELSAEVIRNRPAADAAAPRIDDDDGDGGLSIRAVERAQGAARATGLRGGPM